MKTIAFATGAAAIAGCCCLPAVGPDYEKPDIDTPSRALDDAGLPTTNLTATGEYKPAEGEDDVRAVITTNDVARWWRHFNDPVLTGLVDAAVTNNMSYLMARERLVASRWELVGTFSAFMPRLDASGGFARMERGENTSTMWGTGRTLHRDMYSGGFDATWEIDLFGGSRRATEAAFAAAMAEECNLDDAKVSLTAEVGRQYIELRTTQQRIEVARTNLVLQSETYDILKSRLDSGIGDELAVSQSKYIVDETRAGIPALLAQEETLKYALAILVGEMPGILHDSLADCPRRDWLIEPRRLESAPVDLIRGRPDVRAAERRLAAEVARIGVAKSLWYPKLYLNGSLGLESVKAGKFLERGALYGSLGPSVSWPIFQGGNLYANEQAVVARASEACYAYEFAIENAFREVCDAYAAYTQEYHRYEALKGAVKAAQDAVAISNDLYKNGLRDFTAVIDAQRSLLRLQESLVVSRGQISSKIIALYKALGGGLSRVDDEDGEAKDAEI